MKLLYEIQQIRSIFQATKNKLLSRYIRKLNSEINKRRNEWNMYYIKTKLVKLCKHHKLSIHYTLYKYSRKMKYNSIICKISPETLEQ